MREALSGLACAMRRSGVQASRFTGRGPRMWCFVFIIAVIGLDVAGHTFRVDDYL
jgi:hypothetical protein